jgi:glycosyltransferase involved in cell wall biosynthesis
LNLTRIFISTLTQIKREKNGDFLFYTISSSFSRRKNFAAFIKAFHLEFDKSEPVNIVIKIHKDNNSDGGKLRDFVNQIKAGLRLGETKEEILLPIDYLEDKDVFSIHNSCDVFVSTSYGEGWCIPAFDAMAFGKTPIVNNWSGCDYIDESTGWRVEYNMEPVFGMDGANFSGRENWAAISINHLRKSMREAYSQNRDSKIENGIAKMFGYTHKEIGSLIKKALYD